MRVCPKCGYIEYEYWRQNRWRTNVEFSPLEQFRDNYPELTRDLEKNSFAIDQFYAYRLSGKGKTIVERIIIQEYNAAGMQAFHIPREKVESHSQDIL